MAEYIEREAVCSDCKNQKVCVDKSVCPVGRAPAADVEVVKHGRCKFCEDLDRISEAVCYLPHDNGNATDIPINFCPNCGAKVDLEVEG